jgi:hypothetical protein
MLIFLLKLVLNEILTGRSAAGGSRAIPEADRIPLLRVVSRPGNSALYDDGPQLFGAKRCVA